MALTHLTSETFDQAVNAGDDLVVVDKLTWEPTDEFDKGCGLCMAYGNEDFANC